MAGDNYRLPGLDLRSGTARLTANGTFTKTAGNLDFRLAAPNLAEALANAGGAVTAQGHLSGPWKAPRVVAQASGQSIVYQTYSVETVSLNGDVDLGAAGPLVLNLKAASVGLNGQKYDTVTLTSQGTRQSHQITLAVRQTEESAHSARPRPGRRPAGDDGLERRDPPPRPHQPADRQLAARRSGRADRRHHPGGPQGLLLDLRRRPPLRRRPVGQERALERQRHRRRRAVLAAQALPAAGSPDHRHGRRHLRRHGEPRRRRHRQPRSPPRPGGDPLPHQGGADRPDPLRPGDRPHGRRRRRADRPRRPHLPQHRSPAGRPAAAAVQQDRRPAPELRRSAGASSPTSPTSAWPRPSCPTSTTPAAPSTPT